MKVKVDVYQCSCGFKQFDIEYVEKPESGNPWHTPGYVTDDACNRCEYFHHGGPVGLCGAMSKRDYPIHTFECEEEKATSLESLKAEYQVSYERDTNET